MFEHFFPLVLPIFVGQTPKYSVVCFKTDCAIYRVTKRKLTSTWQNNEVGSLNFDILILW